MARSKAVAAKAARIPETEFSQRVAIYGWATGSVEAKTESEALRKIEQAIGGAELHIDLDGVSFAITLELK